MKKPRTPPAADDLRLQLRERLHQAGVSQSILCERLEKRTGETWRASRLSKMLNGHIVFPLDAFVMIVEEAGLSLVEVVRQRGREYMADVTPTELRILELVRSNPARVDGLVQLLGPREEKPPTRAIIRDRMRRKE